MYGNLDWHLKAVSHVEWQYHGGGRIRPRSSQRKFSQTRKYLGMTATAKAHESAQL